jgi:hypothetical protein
MDELKNLESLGFRLPSPAYIACAVVFSIINYAAYRYGRKATLGSPKWIGIALTLYGTPHSFDPTAVAVGTPNGRHTRH